ncbi:MAG: tetratricopeptide repeat protein [Deltaproteobacteria bacterium]|nr:tetratricopeptide repeat protein [Deltaproteobacteria bacterium]
MQNWKITGIIATLAIVLSLPLYLLKNRHMSGLEASSKIQAAAEFVGRDRCLNCHREEHNRWQGSDHDRAMAVADETSVLGDFNNATFTHRGVVSRFFRKGAHYFVNTQGPGGEMGDFEIKYTFGFRPLQQYLVPFPGGRLQCLPMAWDVEKRQWYHLYPGEKLLPGDWLYWTNSAQNWNGMCAECHSTNLKKGYDPEKDAYQTTWSEINVSCEACHGPGSRHVAWADAPPMARSQTVQNYDLVVNTATMDAGEQVILCARCHSRRSQLGDFNHQYNDFLESMVPQLLTESLYFTDGQILDEVYVYGSFTQSKMYSKGVRCSDCHDVHACKPLKEGNQLCLQCHRSDIYDTRDHHFHKQKGEPGEPIKTGDKIIEVGTGAECSNCHMPGRYYMGVDYRFDHSLRIPRLDLSMAFEAPNACTQCHSNKTDQWSEEYIAKWYGIRRRPHYGTVFAKARRAEPEARAGLIRIANDALFPAIVRSTALSLLSSYRGDARERTFKRALEDELALIRHTALRHYTSQDPEAAIKNLAPLLYDPVKGVRMEAAANLVPLATRLKTEALQKAFAAALEEYKAAMHYSLDFAFAGHNLGNMYLALGDTEAAEANFLRAIRIDDAFLPAKINLAMLYNQEGRNKAAEKLFREAVAANPEFYEAAYSLGLLLAENKDYEGAAVYLVRAAAGMSDRPRVHYNLGILLQHLNRPEEAEAALKRAAGLEPNNLDYLYALTDYYIKQGRWEEAEEIAGQMVKKHPQIQIGHEILNYIRSNR